MHNILKELDDGAKYERAQYLIHYLYDNVKRDIELEFVLSYQLTFQLLTKYANFIRLNVYLSPLSHLSVVSPTNKFAFEKISNATTYLLGLIKKRKKPDATMNEALYDDLKAIAELCERTLSHLSTSSEDSVHDTMACIILLLESVGNHITSCSE